MSLRSLRRARKELMSRADLRGADFCRALAAAADQWLRSLLVDAADGALDGLALVAVGGYGRGELCPFSDLDLVLIHDRRDVSALADAIWYPVWDDGTRLDHSVRQPGEVLEMARTDLRVQLGLLDGRVVAGDEAMALPVLESARDLWRRRAAHWLPELADQVDRRHTSQGDTAFLLEPDLKESHGGLRDVHEARALSLAAPLVAEHVDLSVLDGATGVLTEARVELHRATGRATDRLLLQEQDEVAAALGFTDADAFMSVVAEAGRTIAWATDDAWRRRSLWSPASSRRVRLRRPTVSRRERRSPALARRVVEPGIAVVSDDGMQEVALDVGARLGEDPTMPLRLAAVAAERSLPIERTSLEALADKSPAPPATWAPDMRGALVRVLATGSAAIAPLEALDQKGLLGRLLPEWQAVRNRPQRNAYHRYTVDRHLLETAAHAAPLALRVERPDLLLLAALFHDIGKGYPGDHTDAGVEVVSKLGTRLGLPDGDREILVGLVRNHLLLANLATRRDLDDPATVSTLVDATGDRVQLELLAALSEADGIATGPAAWGPWKAGLVADLARRAAASMAGERPATPASIVTERHRTLMRQVEVLGRSVLVPEVPTLTVVARDRPGLLAAATGVLALRGLDVRSANVASENGFAVEIFSVERSHGRWPDWERVADELEATLRGSLPLAERLAEQERTYAGSRGAESSRPVATNVTVDNAASVTCSVVEVRAPDALGLLHRLTSCLFDEGLDVVAARVSTLGPEVVDAFYVRDESGAKVTNAERIRHIDRQMSAAARGRA